MADITYSSTFKS